MKFAAFLCAAMALSTTAVAQEIRSLRGIEIAPGTPGVNGGFGLVRTLPRAEREYKAKTGVKNGPVFVPLSSEEQLQLRAIADFLVGTSPKPGTTPVAYLASDGSLERNPIYGESLKTSIGSGCKIVDAESISFEGDKPARFGIIGLDCRTAEGSQAQFFSVRFETGKEPIIRLAPWFWIALPPATSSTPSERG
jgi:hypothetical protein